MIEPRASSDRRMPLRTARQIGIAGHVRRIAVVGRRSISKTRELVRLIKSRPDVIPAAMWIERSGIVIRAFEPVCPVYLAHRGVALAHTISLARRAMTIHPPLVNDGASHGTTDTQPQDSAGEPSLLR